MFNEEKTVTENKILQVQNLAKKNTTLSTETTDIKTF